MGQRGENIPEIFPSDNDNDPEIEICVQVHTVQGLSDISYNPTWPRKTPQLTVNDTFFGRYDCFDWLYCQNVMPGKDLCVQLKSFQIAALHQPTRA